MCIIRNLYNYDIFFSESFLGKHVNHLETTMANSTQAQRIKVCEFCQDPVQNFCRGCKYGASVHTVQQTTFFLIHLKHTTLFHSDTEQEIAYSFVDAHACRLRNPYITVLIAVIHFVIIVKVAIPSIHRAAYQDISTCLLIYYKVRI